MKHLISTSYSTQSIITAPLICPISIWTSSRIVCTANRKIPWLVVQHRPRFIGFRLIAPILSFTAEEIWSYLPHAASDDAKSVFLNEMPKASGLTEDADFMAKWDLIYQTRMEANKVLEEKRNEKLIGKSLEAKVTIAVADDAQYTVLSEAADILAKVLIVSVVSVVKAETTYTVERAAGEKCERCWMYLDSVGKNAAHPTLCARCASVVDQL